MLNPVSVRLPLTKSKREKLLSYREHSNMKAHVMAMSSKSIIRV